MKKLICIFLLACILTIVIPQTVFATSNDLDGTVAVIYTANIRGDISVLPKAAALKAEYAAKGATALLVDLGNFLQGTVYSSYDSGKTLVTLMEAAGYDAVVLGSHEFDFGTGEIGVKEHQVYYADDTIGKILSDASFIALSANIKIKDSGLYAFNPTVEIPIESGPTVGLFGLTSTDVEENVLESNISELEFVSAEAAAEEAISELKDCDIIIGLSNSKALKTSKAIMLDSSQDSNFPMLGVALIDAGTFALRSDTKLDITKLPDDKAVREAVDTAKAKIDAEYPGSSVMKSQVTLSGLQSNVRSRETALGNLWCDSLMWFAQSGEIERYYDEDDIANGNSKITVDDDKIVAIWNGGNLRDFLNTGDVTMKDIKRVLPYPNRVAVMYLNGEQLLELLEAASQGLPYSEATADICASFMQTAGINYSVAEYKPYDAGEAYGTLWHKANSINRVTIDSINGKPFDKTAIYAVVTSNAVYNGMDSNYISAQKDADLSVITSAAVTDVVWMYINSELGGVVSARYASPDDRIVIYSSEGEKAPATATQPVSADKPDTTKDKDSPQTPDSIMMPLYFFAAALVLLVIYKTIRQKTLYKKVSYRK